MRAGRCCRRSPGSSIGRGHINAASSSARPPQQLQSPQHVLADISGAWLGAVQAQPSSSSRPRRVVATRSTTNSASASVSTTPPEAAADVDAAASDAAAAAAEPSAAADSPELEASSLAAGAAASWEEEIEETLKLTRLLPPSGELAVAATMHYDTGTVILAPQHQHQHQQATG